MLINQHMRQTIIKLVLGLLLMLNYSVHLQAANTTDIAILLSDSLDIYKQTADDFSVSMNRPISVFNLHGNIRKDPNLKQKLFANKPKLILALGAKAAFVAKLWTQDKQHIPVVFANVLNWSKYKLLSGQKNITGIASETAPGNQFNSIALFAPDIQRVAVIYNEQQSKHIIEDAKQAAGILGLELISKTINNAGELRAAYNELVNQVDAFWVLNDPVTFTIENMAWMNKRCIQYRLACVGQSENAAKLGFLLSVNPDQKNIGSQAASLAKSILLR
ncbi:MAG: hypothetical protein HQL46_14910, partial [Gammaproteobacteria bacterium]|nr:hypothetical protein [Gammaproteobacteria bacterium]